MTHARLPDQGRDAAAILDELDGFAAEDPAYRDGRIWSLVYHLDDAHDDFAHAAYRRYSSANGLNPAAFRSLKRMETDIVSMAAGILRGGPDTCGVLTAGGTESCLLAVKTYRDMARKTRRVSRPNMVIPATAHVAWFKAAEYFGVKPRLLPMTAGHATDIVKLARRIDRNTVMVLGSAPEYPHGTIDPIAEMAGIAAAKGVPVHVDACVGGFILPFMEMNGADLPDWDFRVPGVTSISADLHKYGYAAKGASLILYRDLDLLKHQMFVHQDWPGGVFASPALLGTRPGGAYAAAWAVMQKMGTDGYRDLARRTSEAVEALKAGIAATGGLAVIGNPQGPLLAYRSTDPDLNIFAVADRLEARGWSVNRVQNPDGIHAMVTARHREVTGAYLADLAQAVAEVRADPALADSGSAAAYGMMAHVPLRGMVKSRVLDIFAEMYRAGGGGGVDLHAGGEPGLIDRIATRYVRWKSRRG
ncbi:pyridoxal phosphate-dependent decarboxylase family protein [Pukyongiella litopenaei]|uniref:Aspartate aminotransferase family protein n=1 Tax=Pukyongiella litopenaei TaxID=2605946 RepID=A0A2S0MLG7_9RHOB|nr:aspartate aminotransferase family protein [Pukyongiella litopenaei]AVO36735.1 aspartate aminotransferase family protein [Pukyongiella litopenaei]